MKYSLFFIFTILASCNREKSDNTIIDTTIDIFIENSAGENLLTDTTENTINLDSIRLEFLINGIKYPVYDVRLDYPRSFFFIQDSSAERIRIFPNDAESEEYPITYILWNSVDVDTVKCHNIRKNDNDYISCDKVWYNGVLMYPDSLIVNFPRAFKIVK